MTFDDAGYGSSNNEFHVGDSIFTSLWLDKNWYFDHMDEFDRSIPDIVEYDATTKTLSFPEIIDTVTGEFYNGVDGTARIQPTGKTIRLKFNGKYFEPVGE